MNLLLLFLGASLVLGLRATDATVRRGQRFVMAGAVVLAAGYLNLRFI